MSLEARPVPGAPRRPGADSAGTLRQSPDSGAPDGRAARHRRRDGARSARRG